MRSDRLVCALIFTLVATSAAAQSPIRYRTVAISGELVPGGAADESFFRFEPPILDSSGRVAFISSTNRAGGIGRGVWSEGFGALSLVAQSGAAAPGTPSGVTFDFFDSLNMNDQGQTVFGASLAGPGVGSQNGFGVWTERPTVALVARAGDFLPGQSSGAQYTSFGNLLSGPSGSVGFFARLGGAPSQALLSERSGPTSLVANAGQAAPGMPAGISFTSFLSDLGVNSFRMNQAGRVAFQARASGAAGNRAGIWSDRTGTLMPEANVNMPAPGVPGATFVAMYPGQPAMNNAGMLAFSGVFQPAFETERNGLWFAPVDESPQLILQTGAVPANQGNVTLRDFAPVAMNDAGKIAFGCNYERTGGTTGNCIATWENGVARTIAMMGDSVPGAPGWAINDLSFFANASINARGQVAFSSLILNPAIGTKTAVFVTDLDGSLVRLPVRGELFQVAPGDVRTISGIEFAGISDGVSGTPSSFNDRSELAFKAYFTDGSQAIVVATVPEPASAGLLVLVLSAVASRGRGIATCAQRR